MGHPMVISILIHWKYAGGLGVGLYGAHEIKIIVLGDI